MITDKQVDEMVAKLGVAFGAASKGELVRMMVNRFLCWKLPKDFAPDAGISFKPTCSHDSPHWPIGTNLLNAEQAEDMVRHMLTSNA